MLPDDPMKMDKFELAHYNGACKKNDPVCPYCRADLLAELYNGSENRDLISARLSALFNSGLTLGESAQLLMDERRSKLSTVPPDPV